MTTWTDEDRVAARRQGWDLFETDQGSLQIQRLDDPDAWRSHGVEVQTVWEDDTDVWEYLMAEPTPLHDKALDTIRVEAPVEYRAMRRWVSHSGRPDRDRVAAASEPRAERVGDNRLSDDDRKAMRNAIADRIGAWQRRDPAVDIGKEENRRLLEYRAARAIGCDMADLRDSELDEINQLVDTAVKSASDDDRNTAATAAQPGRVTRSGRNRIMSTWLETGPAWMDSTERQKWRDTVGNVVANLDHYFPDDQAAYLVQARGDRAYSFWLRLVDEQLAELPAHRRGRPAFPWRQAYETGWPPREAACTAWSGLGDRPEVLEVVHVLPAAPRPAQPAERGGLHG
jgi:hypothetical protein